MKIKQWYCKVRWTHFKLHIEIQINHAEFLDLRNPIFANLNSSSSFQVLFDFRSKWIVKPSQFLIEFHVTFIDVINVCFIMMGSATTVLLSLLNPLNKNDGKK